MPYRNGRRVPKGWSRVDASTIRIGSGFWAQDLKQAVPREHIGHAHRAMVGESLAPGYEGGGDLDSVREVRSSGLAGIQAAGEVFEVVLEFAGVMRVPA